MYRRLCRSYGYTPNQVADMTPYQQYVLLHDDVDDDNDDSRFAHFSTHDEYIEWLNNRER